MNKDSYYFPHFYSARNDRKIKRIRKEFGIEGYAIYFMILEVLREQDEFKYPIIDIDLLADDFGTSEQKVKAIIVGYELFDIDNDEMFFSPKFNEYMQPYIKMKEQRKLAGIKSGESRKIKSENKRMLNDRSTDVQRMLNENEQSKVKESKVNKSKVNKSKVNESKEEENILLQCNKNVTTIIDSTESIEELKKIKDNLKKQKNNIDNEIKEKIQEWTNNDELRNTLFNYIQHRKDLKKPVKTINTLNLIFNQLEKNKNNAIEMLNQSILNGWIGLFDVRSTVKAGTGNNTTSNNIFDEIGRERGIW